jgi:type IV pilus assembly protein PilY1
LAHSDQNLKLFVLDLKTGIPATTTPIDTGIGDAFAGSMLNATSDVDQNYQDDIIYVGYVKKTTLGSTWTNGGVGRLQTKEDPDPNSWTWSTLIDDIGPVTSAVTRLINKNKGQLWVFFGTGRYYYEQTSSVDDADGQRTLYGLKDPCYTLSGLNHDCTSAFSGTITDVTSTPSVDPNTITNGWFINLDGSGSYSYSEGNPPALVTRNYRAERVITDPLATSSGLVFFTSYKPYDDVCAYGGKSFIWALRYNSGGAPGALLKGIALLQVSTGSIEQVNLSSAFTEKGGRRTSALEGVPPVQQGLSLLSTPPPVKRTIHIRER